MRHGDDEFGVLREVADGLDAQLRRLRGGHRQRIGVLKAERHADPQAQRLEIAPHRGQVGRLRVLQDLGVDGAAVLGVDVDRAGLQRLEHDRGVAQALPVLGLGVRRSGLRDHLAEDVRLGEALGADRQRVAVGGVRCRTEQRGERQPQADRQAPACAGVEAMACDIERSPPGKVRILGAIDGPRLVRRFAGRQRIDAPVVAMGRPLCCAHGMITR